jgi:hypothetical protein
LCVAGRCRPSRWTVPAAIKIIAAASRESERLHRVYAFIHIEKTAGSTLTTILRRSFGTRRSDIRLPPANYLYRAGVYTREAFESWVSSGWLHELLWARFYRNCIYKPLLRFGAPAPGLVGGVKAR